MLELDTCSDVLCVPSSVLSCAVIRCPWCYPQTEDQMGSGMVEPGVMGFYCLVLRWDSGLGRSFEIDLVHQVIE